MNAEPNPEFEKPNQNLKELKKVSLICILLLLLGSFFWLTRPVILKSYKNENKASAISNSKQVCLALFEFENDYGSYPNAETAKIVTEAFPNHGYDLSGNSSNAAFRQLIAAGIVQTEDTFYFPVEGSKKPDGNISPGHALEKGECNFAYIAVGSTAGNPSRPLLIGNVIPGTTTFDPKPYNGIAIVLKVDQSASAYKIAKDGHVYDKGIDILSPKHPVWKGKTPDIRYPE